jgi:acetylornithine deacetylase/succinyl-diaminopimelate desuccinylase-like protein
MRARPFVLSFLIAMPISLNTRALSQTTPKEEIARVAEARSVHNAFGWIQQREIDLKKFQTELVNIPAPPFAEQRRAEWLAGKFREAGLTEVEVDKIGNVTGLRKGSDPQAKLVAVTAHIDTVFPAGTPVSVRVEDKKMFGPGISDNGAGVTALFALGNALRVGNVANRAGILFVGNVGEEGEGDLRGMRSLFQESKYKDRIGYTLVLDGAGSDTIVTQALGSHRFEVTVRGPGGHSWTDFGAPNPIIILSRAIAKFSETAVPNDPRTSFNVGTITGGTSVNSIPETASARVDIRSASADEIDKVERALRTAVENAVGEYQAPKGSKRTGVTYEIKPIGTRPAAELPNDARILKIVRAVDQFLAVKSQVRRASTDANIPLSQGREAISIGAGGTGGGAHTIGEWYDTTGRDLGLKRILLTVLALSGI